MTGKKRTMSFILAICVTVVMLFSMFYVAAETNHHCADGICPICCQISICEHMLKTLATVVVAAGMMLIALCMGCICMPIYLKQNLLVTLITLKVKLSN